MLVVFVYTSRMVKSIKRFLHLVHRWAGIVSGLLILLWLLSGAVMVFVSRPSLSFEERIQGLPPLDEGSLKLSARDAWAALRRPGDPQAARLNAPGGTATYHFLDAGRWYSARADGEAAAPFDDNAARRAVKPYLRGAVIDGIGFVERDQWSVSAHYDAWRPLARVDLSDGRSYYVSSRTGEVVLKTAFSERAWNWAGTVIHWLYFTDLRQNFDVWRMLILWSSFIAGVAVLSGLFLGVERLGLVSRYSDGRISPYREQWKRYHHLGGLVGGVFLALWLMSGWLSLSPFGWAEPGRLSDEERRWFSSGVLDAEALSKRPRLVGKARELEWKRLDGQAGVFFYDESEIPRRAGFGEAGNRVDEPYSLETLARNAKKLKPGSRLIQAEWLNAPDAYYYPKRRPLRWPIARLRFDDDESTVYYIDPVSGDILLKSHRSSRWRRWLYQGAHRFDLPPLDRHETLRRFLVMLATALGLIPVVSGCVLGYRRLAKRARH